MKCLECNYEGVFYQLENHHVNVYYGDDFIQSIKLGAVKCPQCDLEFIPNTNLKNR
jgi:hypothetical protein